MGLQCAQRGNRKMDGYEAARIRELEGGLADVLRDLAGGDMESAKRAAVLALAGCFLSCLFTVDRGRRERHPVSCVILRREAAVPAYPKRVSVFVLRATAFAPAVT